MKILSVNIGSVQPLANAKEHGVTGIFKQPVAGSVHISKAGLPGDAICDVENHGGMDQAVYVFGASDYAWWSEHLGAELEPGTFGENLTITELESAMFNIGDVLRIGAVELQITAPRIPCVTLAARMGDPAFLKRFRAAERPGLYCRVLREGAVSAGDAVEHARYEKPTITAIEMFRDFYTPDLSEANLRRHLAAPVAIRARAEKERLLDAVVKGVASAPLFRDPIYDGAADPTLIWNREEQAWWLLYTNRRASVPCQGVSWCHGTHIGVASSRDGGRTWLYRGTLPGLEFEPGSNTFWAPEVLWHDGVYHMYVSYVPGIPSDWSGPRHIVHKTSRDLWHWKHESVLALSSDKVIDACVYRLSTGTWRMWYKDEANGSHTYAADSEDLYRWTVAEPVITDCAHEGPNVFDWKGRYWMITDHWRGLGVYRSDDLVNWARKRDILDAPGGRRDDGQIGRHADVVVNGDRAFIVYFTHPDRGTDEHYGFDVDHPLSAKRTSIQVAELTYGDNILRCDRDQPLALDLGQPVAK